MHTIHFQMAKMDVYLPNFYNDISNDVEYNNDSDFQLGEVVTFGYSKVCASQMVISEDGLSARKRDPTQFYAYGVVYGEKPLSGVSEFELEIVRYGSGWSGTVKIGLVKVTEDKELTVSDVPRYSPDAPGYCVWCADKLYNNLLIGKSECSYGGKNLDSLRAGSRVGLRVDSNGNLTFLVDGHSQGIASKNVISKGHKLYVVVDHYANCIETRITRAVVLVEVRRLQDMCLEVIRKIVPSSNLHRVPLPHQILQKLHLLYQ